MKFTLRWFWGMASVVLLCAIAAAETGANSSQVRVLVYRTVPVPGAILERARIEALRIFHAAGIQLLWVNCSYEIPNPACRVEATGTVLYLHIVAGTRSSNDMVYGEAFVAEDGGGNLADLFFDRIKNAERTFGIDPGRLLGTVAAHEIGHLLLGSHAHWPIGIMTPIWEGDSLRFVGMGALFFTPNQMIRMRERLRQDDPELADVKTGNQPAHADSVNYRVPRLEF